MAELYECLICLENKDISNRKIFNCAHHSCVECYNKWELNCKEKYKSGGINYVTCFYCRQKISDNFPPLPQISTDEYIPLILDELATELENFDTYLANLIRYRYFLSRLRPFM